MNYCFEVFFLLGILFRTLDMTVLEELALSFSKKFLVDLKIFLGLLLCFVFIWFCIFYLPNILQKVLKHFSYSGSHLTLAQICAPFYCLCSPGVTFLQSFNYCFEIFLKFQCDVLSPYLSQEILIFLCNMQFLEKNGTCLFSARFFIFQQAEKVTLCL